MSDVSDALRAGGARAKNHDAQMVTKLPASAKALVKVAAEAQGVSEAAIVRVALAEYFEKRGYRS